MQRLFQIIGSRRRQDDDYESDAWSPFTRSPSGSHHRHSGRSIDDDENDIDDVHDAQAGQNNAFAHLMPPKVGLSYFDQPVQSWRYRNERNEEDERRNNDDDMEDEDGDEDEAPILPIFSATHLDRLPLYNITHAIRLLIVQKCETTLSWDQLRSPQISQFLVKPIQAQIRMNHFNRATLCALIANCLQFHKEGQSNPANAGVSKTRALVSELLAMRLLKEFTTYELIDGLSYDFDPLQGMTASIPENTRHTVGSRQSSDVQVRSAQGRGARVSTIEIAIRAEAKRFLAHPLIVQHLEAIWAGNIVFHSAADSLHRKDSNQQSRRQQPRVTVYGTLSNDNAHHGKPRAFETSGSTRNTPGRRSVTLYNPREASLFKLSRLRVPRYRQVFSTLSFATMLGLFVAVLYERSVIITPLEILFWAWSIGYMLDEVVGFSEQGFGLYILSFWNAFDLGILLLFATYYCLRLYGIVLAESGKHRIASLAYDVLASTATLLFPRLFSVLDHYKYFSQLLIAFRMMAQDLIAVLVLILISCSGFFVAFTLAFADKDTTNGNDIAYALFQIVMGFTPAAWDQWAGYNFLGKALLAAFLIICHFLIVTILITVLTNSFMAIVKNAEEEHQFLFAINTISMVKSDALFSYVAPTNIIGWLLSPLRYILPLRQYIKLNRTIIKVSHAPILFVIFLYERTIMARSAFVPADFVEKRTTFHSQPVAFTLNKAQEVFSPYRLREPSLMSFNKDRALDEVFRRPFHGDTVRTTTRDMDIDRGRSTNVVDNWMQVAENEGGASPPLEQPRSVLERLEGGRPIYKRANTAVDRLKMKRVREYSTATRSVASDPDVHSLRKPRRPHKPAHGVERSRQATHAPSQETDADGDDETIDEADTNELRLGESAISIRDPENRTPAENSDDDEDNEYFSTPRATKSPLTPISPAARARIQSTPDWATPSAKKIAHKRHTRNTSTGTTLFAPQPTYDSSTSYDARIAKPPSPGKLAPAISALPGNLQRTNSKAPSPLKSRPGMPARQHNSSANIPIASSSHQLRASGLSFMQIPPRNRDPSFAARALDLASEIGDNRWTTTSNAAAGGISGMPASFNEQLMRDDAERRRRRNEQEAEAEREKGMVNRIMLARMHTLEEGFREVLREIKDMSQAANSASRRESEVESTMGRAIGKGKEPKRTGGGATGESAGGRSDGRTTKKSPKKPSTRKGLIAREVESGLALPVEGSVSPGSTVPTDAAGDGRKDDDEKAAEK